MIALPRELELVLPRMAGVDLPGDQARMACRVAPGRPLGLETSVCLMLSCLRCPPDERCECPRQTDDILQQFLTLSLSRV